MTRATQISLVYLVYATIAAMGLLPLTPANGFAVVLGVLAPDIISWVYRPKGERYLTVPDHILYVIGGMAVGIAIALPQLFVAASLFLFAMSGRIWIALHTELGVQFSTAAAGPQFGALRLNLTRPRDFALRWVSCCITIALIADTIIPRSMQQGFALIAELQRQGLI